MPTPTNCLPFDRARGRTGDKKGQRPVCAREPSRHEHLADIFDQLSPAQCAFLSGVFALLSEHGEEALTRSCRMVIERFERGEAR